MAGNQKTASCGCAEGRAGLFVGLVLFVLVVVFNPSPIQVTGWPAALLTLLVLGVGMAVGGGLAGKIFGQRRARKRLVE